MDSTPSTDDKTPEDTGIPDVETPVQPQKQTTPKRTGIRRAIPAPRTPRGGPKPVIRVPDFSEWHDFLANFAIKWICRGYIAFVFRGVDRWKLLSTEDNEALEPDDEQLRDIAKPLAHIAEKSKFGKTYGRLVMDSVDGMVAAIQLTMWANRVNRIARKYRNLERLRNGTIIPGNVEYEPESEGSSGNGVSGPSFVPPSPASNGFTTGHGYN